ncbi:uncharacterized protein LOC144444931 [Glandiceps talaboti]
MEKINGEESTEDQNQGPQTSEQEIGGEVAADKNEINTDDGKNNVSATQQELANTESGAKQLQDVINQSESSTTQLKDINQSEANKKSGTKELKDVNQSANEDSANESDLEEWSSYSGDSECWESYTGSDGSSDEMGKKLGIKNKKGYIIYSKEEFKEEYPAVEQPEKKKKKRRFLRRRKKKKKDGEDSECSVYSEYSVYTNTSYNDDEKSFGLRRKSMNDFDVNEHVIYTPDANERAIDVPGVNNEHADVSAVNNKEAVVSPDVNESATDVPAGFMRRIIDQKQRKEMEIAVKSVKKEDDNAQRIEASVSNTGKPIPYERLRNEPVEQHHDVYPPTRAVIDQSNPPKKPPRVKSMCSPTEEKQIIPSLDQNSEEITYHPAEQQVFVSPSHNEQSLTNVTDETTQLIPPPKPKRLSQTLQDSTNNNNLTVAQIHVNKSVENQEENERYDEKYMTGINQDISVMDNIDYQLNESLTVESVMKELDDTISQASEEFVMEGLPQQPNDVGNEGTVFTTGEDVKSDEIFQERGVNQEIYYVSKEEVEYGRTDQKMKYIEGIAPKTPPPTPASDTPPMIHNLVIPYQEIANLELNRNETKAPIGSASRQTENSPNGKEGSSSTTPRRRYRSRKSSKASTGTTGTTEDDSEEDEDCGIYDESYRLSTWIYVGENDEPVFSPSRNSLHGSPTSPSSNDSGFSRDRVERGSTSTTASEAEFQMCYQSIARRRRIVRSDSTQDYTRLSINFRERTVIVNKKDGQFGFRIQYSRPVRVTGVDIDGAAEDAGLQVGDAVLEVNGHDTTMASHFDVVKHVQKGGESISLVVGTRISNALNLPSDQPIVAGFLHKQGQTGLKLWKKRYFALKHDHCLYYYKTDREKEPVGAIVLPNYTVTKAHDCSKEFTFKLTKYGARTYYLQAANEDEMSRWAGALAEATNAKNKADPWLGISTHNVGLPAYSIANPECHGYLYKMGGRRKNWRRRYCVLKDACLYYYTDVSATMAQGVAHFHGYSIQETEFGNKKFAFTLKPPNPEMRTWCFNADHDVDRKRWIASLAESIGHWICMDDLPTQNIDDDDDDESAEYEDI